MKIHIKSAEKALKAIYFNQFYSYDLEKNEIKYEDYAVISIRDTSQPSPIEIKPVGNLKAVLVTSFTDLPPSELIADGITKETYDVRYGGYMKPFTVKEAYEIINFVRTLPHSVKHILVHCSAGISRSCAVGAFLEMWLNKNTWKTEELIHTSNYEFLNILLKTFDRYSTFDGQKLPKEIEKPIEVNTFDMWDMWSDHETKFGPKYFTTMLTLNDKINLQKYNQGDK